MCKELYEKKWQSTIINYDLPWNPQKIEQRIGRCHRYGQKNDVVVINLLNTQNVADKRVYEILSEKFELFQGVFGASDKAIGLLESGADFEKRVTLIYQECKTTSDFTKQFKDLEKELEKKRNKKMDELKSIFIYKTEEQHKSHFNSIMKEIAEYDSQFKYWNSSTEGHYLKVMCDEIFGRSNFVSDITYEKSNVTGLGQGGAIFNTGEKLLVYKKETVELNEVLATEKLTKKTMQRYRKYIKSEGRRELVDEFESASNAILVCAWNKQRFVDALLNIGQNVGNSFEYDKTNHMATYIFPIGLTIVYNGNHSSLSGILKGEGTIQANQTYDLVPTYDYMYFDGIYFRNKINDEKLYKVERFEIGALYEIGRLLAENGIR